MMSTRPGKRLCCTAPSSPSPEICSPISPLKQFHVSNVGLIIDDRVAT